MTSITTLFLDAGGVICHPSWARVSAALAAEGVDAPVARLRTAEAFAKKDIDDAVVIGGTTDHARGWLYFNKVLEHAGIPLSAATDRALAALRDYHRVENLWEHVPEDVPPALAAFRARGLTLAVVSNANGRLRYLFERLGLASAFDVILDSHEWGVEKPDPRLFHLALEQAQADPTRTVHVGDLFHIDVAGARAAGLCEGILLDAANLYPDVDCRRVRTLMELVTLLSEPMARGGS